MLFSDDVFGLSILNYNELDFAETTTVNLLSQTFFTT
jgi:hypothetical protein